VSPEMTLESRDVCNVPNVCWQPLKTPVLQTCCRSVELYMTRTHLEKRSRTWTFTQCARKLPEFAEITQYNRHYAVQGNSRSTILIPIESSYAISY